MDIKFSQFPTLSGDISTSRVHVLKDGSNYMTQLSTIWTRPSDVKTLSSTLYTLTQQDNSNILRFSNSSTKIIILPLSGITNNSMFTIRNSGTGSLTLSADGIQTFNYISGSNILPTNTTAQVIYIGSNIWDLL